MNRIRALGALQALAAKPSEPPVFRAALSPREAKGEDHAPGSAPALLRFVLQEVVPSLIREHEPSAKRGRHRTHRIERAEIVRFVDLVVTGDTDDVVAHAERTCPIGEPLESIYLHLIAPAARELEVARQEDRYAFSDITIGEWRLSQVVRHLASRQGGGLECPSVAYRRVLLVPAPGEQHVLGISIVAVLFACAGWDVATDLSCDEAVRIARQDWFDIIGFSAAHVSNLDQLAGEIRRLRKASRNRSVGIMVAGPAFVAHPEHVVLVGADAMAADGLEAPFEAERLLAERACE